MQLVVSLVLTHSVGVWEAFSNCVGLTKVSKNNQKMSQSHTTDQSMAKRGRIAITATWHSTQNKSKAPSSFFPSEIIYNGHNVLQDQTLSPPQTVGTTTNKNTQQQNHPFGKVRHNSRIESWLGCI